MYTGRRARKRPSAFPLVEAARSRGVAADSVRLLHVTRVLWELQNAEVLTLNLAQALPVVEDHFLMQGSQEVPRVPVTREKSLHGARLPPVHELSCTSYAGPSIFQQVHRLTT